MAILMARIAGIVLALSVVARAVHGQPLPLFSAAAAAADATSTGLPVPLTALNNCKACVRCGGVWTAAAGAGGFGACIDTAALHADSPGVYRLSDLLAFGAFPPDACPGNATAADGSVVCPAQCAGPTLCTEQSLCGPCVHAQAGVACVDPPAQPRYAYNQFVTQVCQAFAAEGYPIATNDALHGGASLPPCDCPINTREPPGSAAAETVVQQLSAAAGIAPWHHAPSA